EQLPFDSSYHFISRIPHRFNPDAKMPFLEPILNAWANKDELIDLIGYAMYPRYVKHKIFFLYGGGGNGKSVYLAIVTAVLGKENVSSVALARLSSRESFSTHNLCGKLANIAGEIGPNDLKNMGVIKELTGGEDYIAAKVKNKEDKVFINEAKLINSGNTLPRTVDSSDGAKDRIYIVEFLATFRGTNKEIPDLANKIKAHKEDQEALVYAAVTSARRMYLANDWTFNGEKSKEHYWNRLKTLSSEVMPFLNDQCIITHSKKDCIPTTDFYEAFGAWRTGLKKDLLHEGDICVEMARAGISKRRIQQDQGRPSVFSGIKWK
ncbi:hypothetical protein KJ865_08745, partial [Myxococcota bacterium]|nr:hypothetical protein [Myxococcota bacterium]